MPTIPQFRRAAIVVSTLVAGVAMPSAGARAADPSDPKTRAAFCESYARLTLADINYSVQNHCAKTGLEWSPSFAYHYDRCMQEPDLDAVRRALSTHNLEAIHCREGAQGTDAPSDGLFPPVITDEQPAAATNFPPVLDDATAATAAGAAPPVVDDKATRAQTPGSPPVAGDRKSDTTEAAQSRKSAKHKRHTAEHHDAKHLHGDHHLQEKVRRAARHFGSRLLRSLADH